MVCRSTADVVVIVFQSYCSSHGDSNDQALCLLQRQRSVCKGGGSYQLRLLGNKVCVVSVWLISASGPVSHPLQALCPDLTACSVYLSRVGGCWQLEQPSWIQAIYCMCSCFIESCLAFHPAFKSSYMVACVSMAECVCQGDWQVGPKGSVGGEGKHLWPHCPPPATIKALMHQTGLFAALTPLWAFFLKLFHSIILSLYAKALGFELLTL